MHSNNDYIIEPIDGDVSWQNELSECPFGAMRNHDFIAAGTTVQGFLLCIDIIWYDNQRSSKQVGRKIFRFVLDFLSGLCFSGTSKSYDLRRVSEPTKKDMAKIDQYEIKIELKQRKTVCIIL